MSKIPKTVFSCQNCGFQSAKWLGKCPDCSQWNSFAEEKVQVSSGRSATHALLASSIPPLLIDQVLSQQTERFSTGESELDRLLGGGIVPGSLTLLGGDPGIGKSTLVLQLLGHISTNFPTFYLSGEESAGQIKLRADRLGVKGREIYLFSENDLQKGIEEIEKVRPRLLVIDSIQTMFLPEYESAPGSLTQVRESTARLLTLSKRSGMATWIIGHVTKEGMIAGPKVLEHLVDTVLYFEGDKGLAYRILRTIKNRFGSTNEMGVFEMAVSGLVSVQNPSALFLSDTMESSPGSAVVSSLEGTRPLLVEVQVLTTPSFLTNPRRVSLGVDPNRLSLLVAILEKKGKLSFYNQDLFLNVVGGIRLNEPSADLGILAALASSQTGKILPHGTAYIGEVGLSGEVRPVSQIDLRLAEIERLGFKRVVLASKNLPKEKKWKMEMIGVQSVSEMMRKSFS